MKILLFLLISGFAAGMSSAGEPTIALSEVERAYLARLGTVRLCVDPDWYPFERIGQEGQHEGIAADLLALVSRRTGVNIQLVPTASWEESLKASQNGKCQLLSFLNQSPERDKWLIFTRPLFFDPNVILTKAKHPDISNLGSLGRTTIALPVGTMVRERLERDFPALHVIPTISEDEAIHLVAGGQAEVTVRSLNMAAYTIKKEGLFNLKIAGRLPNYDNELRIGVVREEPVLRDILDKGVATITQTERDAISNRHAAVNLVTRVDYRLFWEVLVASLLVLVLLMSQHRKQRQLDAARIKLIEQKAANEKRAREEQSRLVAMLSHEVKTPLAMIDGAVQTLTHLVDAGQPDVARRLDRIRRGVKRLENLSDRFLHKDRLDSPTLTLARTTTDIGQLVRELVNELEGQDRIRLYAPAKLMAQVDGGLMQLAVKNLVANALTYSPQALPVTITASAQGARIRLSVKDQGEGIPSALKPRLFDCYVRGRPSQDIPGAGLGLYLASRIAQLHGGSIWLADTTSGAEFILDFPASVPEETLPPAPSDIAPNDEAS